MTAADWPMRIVQLEDDAVEVKVDIAPSLAQAFLDLIAEVPDGPCECGES